MNFWEKQWDADHIKYINKAADLGFDILEFQALKDIIHTGRIVSEPFVMMGGEVGETINVWRNLVDDCSEESLDREATFLVDFEKKMIKKYVMC